MKKPPSRPNFKSSVMRPPKCSRRKERKSKMTQSRNWRKLRETKKIEKGII